VTEWLVEPFRTTFMRHALAAGWLAATTCALVGVWVVVRGQTFLGDAVAHGILPGVGVAFAMGASLLVGALVGACTMAVIVAVIGRAGRVRDDVAIGVTFAGMLAAGVLVVGRTARTGGELTGFLFGSIAGVTRHDLVVQGALTAVCALAVVALHRPLTALAFDPAKAEMLGLHPGRTQVAQLLLVALAVVVSYQTLGALLVFALLTAPAASAVLLARRLPGAMLLAAGFGGAAVTVGLIVSWHADTAIGATIATLSTLGFLVTLAGRALYRRLRGALRGRRAAAAAALAACALLGGACGPASGGAGGGSVLRVATSSELFADLVRQVAGGQARIRTIIPPGSDPHSYEPPPSAARLVAEADLVVSNGMMLETRALDDLIEANLPRSARHLKLAEAAAAAGARPRELVEEIPLEVPWLGVEVDVDPSGFDPPTVDLQLSALGGPGRFAAYVAGTLGEPERLFDSDDGIGEDDRMRVPMGAHTHLNWAFDTPGRWEVRLAARHSAPGGGTRELASGTVHFTVGTDPPPDRKVVDGGHLDVTVRYPRGGPGRLLLVHEQLGDLDPARTTILVPSAARDEVPDDPRYRFLGEAGTPLWVLPQAVVGKHTHGRLDPHMWLDPRYVRRYVQAITEALVDIAPQHAETFRRRGALAIQRLRRLDDRLRRRLADIPDPRRQIIATHDAFGYLADAYGFRISGFVAPVPGQEPSAAAVARLERAIRDLPVPVVFQEPNYRRQNDLLARIAARNGARVCTLYGETFDTRIRTYHALMEHNASELRRCLGTGRHRS